jgi:hypothetical protein
MIISDEGAACCQYLLELVKNEIKKVDPNVALISVALGIVESALTAKDEADRVWPSNLNDQVGRCMNAFEGFVKEQSNATSAVSQPREKLKLIANAVCAKNTLSNSVLHAQHVYNFARMLLPEAAKSHLDCASMATTTYCVARQLGIPVWFQVSEDHCFLNLEQDGRWEGSVEVTQDRHKRGQQAEAHAWQGWLYGGGRALLCSPQQVITALINSINPQLSAKKSLNCERLQSLQFHLLLTVRQSAPDAMYPAALCTLADLTEYLEEHLLEECFNRGEHEMIKSILTDGGVDTDKMLKSIEALATLRGCLEPAYVLFKQGIEMAAARSGDGGEDCGREWYPYSCMVGFLCRRSELIMEYSSELPHGEVDTALHEAAVITFKEALEWAAKGSWVLARYKYNPKHDEELFKDLGEGTLEHCCDGVRLVWKALSSKKAAQEPRSTADQDDAALLIPLLTYWDGICLLFAEHAKPGAWVNMVLKAVHMFTPEAREKAALEAQARSSAMQAARPLWRALNLSTMKGVFTCAEVVEGGRKRVAKKPRTF